MVTVLHAAKREPISDQDGMGSRQYCTTCTTCTAWRGEGSNIWNLGDRNDQDYRPLPKWCKRSIQACSFAVLMMRVAAEHGRANSCWRLLQSFGDAGRASKFLKMKMLSLRCELKHNRIVG